MATQLEQLLTCCICLDRFRNPKLLPCQHSVCMEPCMEGLVDYVRRQVKCPECRAEHRIPYNGVQGFPTNVTLQRFLEAHIEITGETPDPFTGQIMERCSVCNEKNYLSVCAHCEKRVCEDCKAAHSEILKREIGRINNQVKRAAHRLGDQLAIIERNISALKHNTGSVTEEVDNISKRLQKAVRDRCDFLKNEVESYYNTELRNMILLKEGMEQEISNVDANTDLAEKHMDDQTPWDDCELMDTKEIFLRTMEFIRNFDYEAGDYNRRAKFIPPEDLNKLASSLTTMGELIIQSPKQDSSYSSGQHSGLMKSKSDHRLAAQFRDQDEGYGYGGRTSPVMSRRRFGERNYAHDGHDSAYESSSDAGGRRRFRSRFMRRGEDEEERSVHFNDEEPPKSRPKVIDTEDVSRGPLSGITRMYDSPRVIKRLQEKDLNVKKKKEEGTKSTFQQTPTKPVVGSSIQSQRKPSRQTSNEDEIDKIKKQNKASEGSSVAGATGVASSTSSSVSKPPVERISSLKDTERQSRHDRSSTSPRSSTQSPSASNYEDESSNRRSYGGSRTTTDYSASGSGTNGATSHTTPSRKTSDTGIQSHSQKCYPFSRSSSTSSVGEGNKVSGTKSPKSLDTPSYERLLSRSNSTDSNKSINESVSPKKSTGAAFSTDELRSRFSKSSDSKATSKHDASSRTTSNSSNNSSRYQSRFLGRAGTPTVEASKESGNEDEEEESSDDSESDDSEDTSEEEDDEKDEGKSDLRSDVGLLLGRSTHSRDTSGSRSAWNDRTYGASASSTNDSGYGSRYGSTDNSTSSNSRYGASASNDTSSTSTSYRRPSYQSKEKEDDFDSKYPYASKYLSRPKANATAEEESKPTFQSRFLNKSKSSAILGPDNAVADEESHTSSGAIGTSRSRFEELKERRQRLAKSKSSAGMDDDETGATSSNASEATSTGTSTYRSRYGRDADTSSPSSTTRTSSSTATSGVGGTEAGGSSTQQLSNWARYLKNKYGNKTGTDVPTGASVLGTGSTSGASGASGTSSATSSLLKSPSSSASSRAIARSRSSHLLGLAKDGDSSGDDSKNVHATPTSPPAGIQAPTPFGSLHRNQYLQKQRLLLKIGSRGSEVGKFTWPRGIAVGPDNSIVVADSSNHRVQVFDQDGNFLKDFGCYGNGEGEFDCLAGVAVNRIGQYIIADRYNHRIQIFDPSGMFLRSFGSQGSGDGKFAYPWGVTTDALGFIYVCDKENHRIQVFQSDGSFVGKFGSIGNKPGQLEHPHYIAVSSTNRVTVSDSNNHRIQIFDVNGKLITTFGSEGSEEGQFKFPRGVAVDDQGYIFVADSGNNRIQIFHPDGSFIRAFGCWGQGDGEFKGLEGVAVMPNGNILVCDRENHRVQIF